MLPAWARHLAAEPLKARADDHPFPVQQSAIVNLARIRELQPTFHGEYAVLLDTGAS